MMRDTARLTLRRLTATGAFAATLGFSVPGTAGDAQPTWESLRHDPPEWLLDAKFGIYTHWGVYSVPAYNGEWYPNQLVDGDKPLEHEKKHV